MQKKNKEGSVFWTSLYMHDKTHRRPVGVSPERPAAVDCLIEGFSRHSPHHRSPSSRMTTREMPLALAYLEAGI